MSGSLSAPCFVVSTGRCGSMMIAEVLDLHPKLRALHEPQPHLNTEAFLRWKGTRGEEYVEQRLSLKRDRLVRRVAGSDRTYVESSHFMSHLVPELRERYGARFVHLFRDGRDFVRSGLPRGWYEETGLWERIATRLRRSTGIAVGDSFRDHRLAPPGELETRFERVAWLWAEINRAILDGIEDLPGDSVFRVRLEAFDRNTIRELIAFLGHRTEGALLDRMEAVTARRPNRTEDPAVPAPEGWSSNRRERFWQIAGGMMDTLGYDRG